MTHRFSARWLLVALACVAVTPLSAQGPRMTPDRLAELAKKPTPKLADGKFDLNGTWDHLGGIEFVRPQSLDGGSVCVVGCPPAAAAPRAGGAGARGAGGGAARAGGPPADPPAPNFPKYKPEFQAKVADLNKRQVETDTALQCQPPGVPRIGPPAKIEQTAREVLFLYDDVNGSFSTMTSTARSSASFPPTVVRTGRICHRATSATRSGDMRAIRSLSRRSTSTRTPGWPTTVHSIRKT